jgi:hypothetical protein
MNLHLFQERIEQIEKNTCKNRNAGWELVDKKEKFLMIKNDYENLLYKYEEKLTETLKMKQKELKFFCYSAEGKDVKWYGIHFYTKDNNAFEIRLEFLDKEVLEYNIAIAEIPYNGYFEKIPELPKELNRQFSIDNLRKDFINEILSSEEYRLLCITGMVKQKV